MFLNGTSASTHDRLKWCTERIIITIIEFYKNTQHTSTSTHIYGRRSISVHVFDLMLRVRNNISVCVFVVFFFWQHRFFRNSFEYIVECIFNLFAIVLLLFEYSSRHITIVASHHTTNMQLLWLLFPVPLLQTKRAISIHWRESAWNNLHNQNLDFQR